jgi:hypothetical protein
MKLSLITAFMAVSTALFAQPYDSSWHTTGGGGTSTGGVFAVSGTIGQADAGTSTGGNYAVSGGFWGVIATVPTPEAPLLTITLNAQLSTITVSWPSPATGWQLRQNNDLKTANWTDVPTPPQEIDGRMVVTIALAPGNRFYRLYKD